MTKFDFVVEGMNQKQEDALLDMIVIFLESHNLEMAGGTEHIEVKDDNIILEEK